MTGFGCLAVLVSVIPGLGMTHLLLGIGRIIHHCSTMRVDAIHAM